MVEAIHADDAQTQTEYTRVPVAGGVLVYEELTLGRELVGFEDVTDWDDVQDALAERGHSRGAVYHKPEL